MKKRFVLPSFIALTAVSLVGTIAGSLAWLSDKANIGTNSNLGGSSDGAYFAYGDGTEADDPSTPVKEGPYGIETARQLYNLAWLQYFGYFNKDIEGVITPVYFELNANIDMTGWVLPPIGTTEYPFIGEFNGRNYKISNLTTSNDYNQIIATNKVPGRVKSAGTISNVNIIGMFGVVGELAGNITATYDTQVTSIKDFLLEKATIKSTTNKTLAGIVAGYVNGPISNVTVDGENVVGSQHASTIDLSAGTANYSFNDGKGHSKAFSNITDYGLIGYAETEYLENVHSKTVETYNAYQREYDYIAQDPDEEQGWGGSIPMDTMFSHLLSYRNTAAGTTNSNPGNSVPYPTKRTIEEDIDGVVQVDQYSNNTTTTNSNTAENKTYYTNPVNYQYNYHNYEQKNANNEVTSSYGFVWYDTQNFVCLTGEKTVWMKNAVTTTKTYYPEKQYDVSTISFRYNNVWHYLTANGTSAVADTTTAASATEWYFDGRRIFTVSDGIAYYLNRNNNNNLSLSTTANTYWDYDTPTNRIYSYTGGTTGYQLSFNGTNWRTASFTVSYVLISDLSGSNYMNYPNGSGRPTNTTNENNATHWSGENNGYFSYSTGGFWSTTYYIRYYSSSYKLYVSDSTSNRYAYNGRYLSYTTGNTTYYAYFDGSSWTTTTTPTDILAIPFYNNANEFNVSLTKKTLKLRTTTTYTEDSPLKMNPTFFPLKETNGVPEELNTGYIVSGGNYKVDQMGDIRFGKFAKSTYLPYGLNTIYTIESDGTTDANSIPIADSRIYSDTERKKLFDKSKSTMQDVLDASNNIDGLHFVDAPINPSKTVIIPRAVINKKSYKNYQVPQDCIDFNLKEKGHINFFAGSYFQNSTIGRNNSFFTLHEIRRGTDEENPANPYPIEGIDEIVAIYTDGVESHSYVYEYKTADAQGRKYSVPFHFVTENQQSVKYPLNDDQHPYVEYSRMNSLYTGYSSTPVFKSSWIGINTLRMLDNYTHGYSYYFDIAMNDGEYALGSVPNGGVGAYLMYLDIGANAKKMFRTEIIEYFKMIDELYIHPKGITLTAVSAGITSTDKNAYCICISDVYTGTLTMEKVVNGDVEEGRYVGSGNASKESVSYKLPSDVLKDENGTIKTCAPVPNSTTVTEIKRMTFYDYGLVDNTLNKIVIEDTYVNSVLQSRTVKKYKNYNVTTGTGTEDADMDLYIKIGDQAYNYKNKTGSITFSTANNTTKLLIFTVAYPDGGVITATFTLKVTAQEDSGHYVYKPSEYDVDVVLTKQSGHTENITALCYITTVLNTDGTYTYTLQFNGTTAAITIDPIILNA